MHLVGKLVGKVSKGVESAKRRKKKGERRKTKRPRDQGTKGPRDENLEIGAWRRSRYSVTLKSEHSDDPDTPGR